MAVRLFELVDGEAGALIPKYELKDFEEFKDLIKKPVIHLYRYERRILSSKIEDFSIKKTLKYFDDLLEEYDNPHVAREYLDELIKMEKNFKLNVEKSNVQFLCVEEASDLIKTFRDLPSSEYILLDINKINEDLVKIYNKS